MDSSYNRKCSSIYRGVVEDNIDPENLGRCKIRVPSVHGELTYPISILPWARPIVLSPVKSGRGSANIPDIGDVVWVLFEGSNKDFPLYLGGTYAKGEMQILNSKVVFYLEEDTSISYDRDDNSYTIKLGNNQISISEEGIHLVGDTQIQGNLSIVGNLKVSGETKLTDLIVTGSFNKE